MGLQVKYERILCAGSHHTTSACLLASAPIRVLSDILSNLNHNQYFICLFHIQAYSKELIRRWNQALRALSSWSRALIGCDHEVTTLDEVADRCIFYKIFLLEFPFCILLSRRFCASAMNRANRIVSSPNVDGG